MNICKLATIITLLFSSFTIKAQTITKDSFISPFKFPLLLSANFGELRGNHFHGGFDIKTGGVVGKPVYCIADGYVSRVLVMAGGYGNALFITHYNGYTSVYGHIKNFSSAVEKVIKDYQLRHETFAVDLKFEPNFIKFKAGDFIASSGNEGMSFGPHLHFEIRNSQTNEYVNPLIFYKDIIADKRAPVAQLIAIYPEKGTGVVNGSQEKKIIPMNALSRPITAWGKIGIGIKAFDYMNNTNNHYGIYQIKLFLDGKQIFGSQMNGVLSDENRRINGYTDFSELKRNRRWIIRSFSLPGNPLRFVESHDDRGIVEINEERNYQFMYQITDAHGNKNQYSFTVIGKKSNIDPFIPKGKMLYWNRANVIQEPGFELAIPKGVLYDDVELNYKVSKDSSYLANIYQINDEPIPLHTYCTLMLGLKNRPVKETNKYYIASVVGKRKNYIGGSKFEDGWIKANIRDLGTYTIAVDTIAPRILPLSKKLWKSGNIQFKIYDNETGIKNYKVFIDGKFYIFAYSLKNNRLVMKYPLSLVRGNAHNMEVFVEDNCGNIVREKYIF